MRGASLAIGVLLLSGCPGWSRPDPRLARRAEPSAPVALAPVAPPPIAPAAPPPARVTADLPALRARLAGARELSTAKRSREALDEIKALEDQGNDLLLRTQDDARAAEVESLLLDVATLRDQVVRGEAR